MRRRSDFAKMRIFIVLAAAGTALAAGRTALDEYVSRPDPAYSFQVVSQQEQAGHVVHVLEMTSQRWLSRREVDRPEWKHWLLVIVPKKVATSTALLFIGGGRNGTQPPAADKRLVQVAEKAQAVVAYLGQVPNQPLRFAGDNRDRVEDALIAYAWDQYLRTAKAEWAPRLPMTKAAVRAMDTVQQFCEQLAAGPLKVERFVVAGGSKRGWTTWTVAAVDRRVAAIIPMVIDVLNVERSMMHHWRAYGFWSPAIHDYEEMGIMNWMGSREFARLMALVDPYSYRDRYTMPKFIINATGDQFFLPDSWQFYFDDLPGEKHLHYVPNADHSLERPEVAESLLAYFWAVAYNQPRPRYQWRIQSDQLLLTAEDRPAEVRLWTASNPRARDFRLETIGPAWESSVVRPDEAGNWSVRLSPPGEGWKAYLLRATFPSGGPAPFLFTTGVKVVPDQLPFPPPQPATPRGTARPSAP